MGWRGDQEEDDRGYFKLYTISFMKQQCMKKLFMIFACHVHYYVGRENSLTKGTISTARRSARLHSSSSVSSVAVSVWTETQDARGQQAGLKHKIPITLNLNSFVLAFSWV